MSIITPNLRNDALTSIEELDWIWIFEGGEYSDLNPGIAIHSTHDENNIIIPWNPTGNQATLEYKFKWFGWDKEYFPNSCLGCFITFGNSENDYLFYIHYGEIPDDNYGEIPDDGGQEGLFTFVYPGGWRKLVDGLEADTEIKLRIEMDNSTGRFSIYKDDELLCTEQAWPNVIYFPRQIMFLCADFIGYLLPPFRAGDGLGSFGEVVVQKYVMVLK